MKLDQVLTYLENLAPGSFQESYDNSGLIAGRADLEVSKLLVCLDVDDRVMNFALSQGCNSIISHHPAIFKAIKTFTEDSQEGSILVKAIKNDIALYSSHTNFDSAEGGLTDILCKRIGLKDIKILKKAIGETNGYGRYGNLPIMSGVQFVDLLKTRLSLDCVRIVGELPAHIKRAAVYNGSYDRDIINELLAIKPDVFITGDLKYHDAQELLNHGIFTIDAGHYGTEKIFTEGMSELLKAQFPELVILRYEGADIFAYL